MAEQLWKGRFSKAVDSRVNDFNSSIRFDQRMIAQDMRGSGVHAAMLAKQGIISEKDCEDILNGLASIADDLAAGRLEIDPNAEDVHTFVEQTLTARIGDAGKRLHTGRSRNDQVALDMKLYTRDEYETVWTKVGSSESIFEFLITSLYNAQRNSLGFYTHAEGYAEAGITEGFKTFLQERPEDVRSTLIAEESDGGDNEGWYIQKYPGRDGEIYVNNPKVIRLSEVYLIAAEAALKAGGADPASYINDLRKQRIADYEDVASVTIDDILTERRLELYGEGHNAWDTWRNKKAVTNAQVPAGPINYDDYRTVMPIPVSEINVSNGKLKQNEGY